MLDTEVFIEKLYKEGYRHFCVVPCSFAKNLINAVINNKKLEYHPCASEAVACSVAAGLKMAGKKPIVIVQSSGLTNMGSCISSLLLPYSIRFPIIVSWRTYNDGDSEIQHQHLATHLPNLVEAYGYTHTILSTDSIHQAINQLIECESENQICLLEKDTFSKVEISSEHQLDLSQYSKRSKYLKILNDNFKNTGTIFIGTTGNTAREMFFFMPDTNNFYMAGNMGGALSVGLGMAKAGENVIVCGGDAEFVMHMGGLTTAGRYRHVNLTYILFDNESNKSTGGQHTYQNHIDYLSIARASGFNSPTEIIEDTKCFIKELQLTGNKECGFLHVKCSYDQSPPRVPINTLLNSV